MKQKGVEIDAEALEQAAALLAHIPKGFETAFVRAANRALRKGRTEAIRSIRKNYTIRARDAKPGFAVIPPTKNDLSRGELRLTGKRPRLSAFKYKPRNDTTGARRKKVFLEAKKGESKRIGDSFVFDGRILTRLKKGDPAINRFGSLIEYRGASVPEMANNPDVVSEVQGAMNETMVKRLDHEVDFLLSKKGEKTASMNRKWGK